MGIVRATPFEFSVFSQFVGYLIEKPSSSFEYADNFEDTLVVSLTATGALGVVVLLELPVTSVPAPGVTEVEEWPNTKMPTTIMTMIMTIVTVDFFMINLAI
jgi:hypothetical protein